MLLTLLVTPSGKWVSRFQERLENVTKLWLDKEIIFYAPQSEGRLNYAKISANNLPIGSSAYFISQYR